VKATNTDFENKRAMTQSSILCSKPPVAPQVTFAARAFNQICNNIRNSRRRSAAKSYFMRPQLVRKRYNLSPRANFFCGAQLSHKKILILECAPSA
jgi:hypothetical protein